MIEFDCPHCGNPFKVRDKHEGRDGWCRVCKRLVIVPKQDGSSQTWDQLSDDDKLQRLDKKLQYAASQADYYKLLIAKFCEKLHRVLNGETVYYQKVDDELLGIYLHKVRETLSELGATSDNSSDAKDDDLKVEEEATLRSKQAADIHEAQLYIEELESQRTAQLDANTEAEERIARLKETLETKEERLQEVTSGEDDSVESKNETVAQIELLRSENDALTEARNEARTQRATLGSELESILSELSATTLARDDAEEQIAHQEKQIATLMHDLEQVREDSLNSDSSLLELSGAVEEKEVKEKEFDTLRTTLEKDLQKAGEESASQLSRIESLEESLDAATKEKTDLESVLTEKKSELAASRIEALEHVDTLDEASDDLLLQLKSDLDEALNMTADYEMAVTQKQAEIETLSARLETAEEAHFDGEAKASEMAELASQNSSEHEASLANKQNEVDELAMRVETAENASKDFEEEGNRLGKELEDVRAELALAHEQAESPAAETSSDQLDESTKVSRIAASEHLEALSAMEDELSAQKVQTETAQTSATEAAESLEEALVAKSTIEEELEQAKEAILTLEAASLSTSETTELPDSEIQHEERTTEDEQDKLEVAIADDVTFGPALPSADANEDEAATEEHSPLVQSYLHFLNSE